MRGPLSVLLAALLTAGCSCESTGITGHPDAAADPPPEAGPDAGCPDRDGDGHADEACGGDDCDDMRDDVYPGAPEVCSDGVDQDCDGIVDGPVVMMGPTHLDTLGHGANNDLAWTGSEFVVVWDYANPFYDDISFARISSHAERIEEIVQLTDHAGTHFDAHAPDITWTGSEIGLAYGVGDATTTGDPVEREVRFLRVSPLGEIIAAPPRLNDVDTVAWIPGTTWTETGFAVVWRDGREGPCTHLLCEAELYLTRLDPLGVEIGTELRVSDSPWYVTAPEPLWTGSEIFTSWLQFEITGEPPDAEWTPRGAVISRLDATGRRTADDVPGPFFAWAQAWTGSEIAMAWSEDISGSVEIFFTRVDPTGRVVAEPTRITDAPHLSDNPVLEWSGSVFGLAWEDGRNTGCDVNGLECDTDIYFTALDPEGSRLWEDVRVTFRERINKPYALRWTGSVFGISWAEFKVEEPDPFEHHVSFDVISFCE